LQGVEKAIPAERWGRKTTDLQGWVGKDGRVAYRVYRREIMSTLKQFFMTAVSALLLASTSAIGDECMSVKAKWNETGFSTDPEVCGGDFDWCISGKLQGRIKGEMWLYTTGELQELYDPYEIGLEDLIVGAAYQTIYTKDGDIYMKAYGLYETVTTVFTELSVVTGGTGKYAGATGQLVAYPDASRPSDYYYSGPLYYRGIVCTP
jgi:hypothetical protein